MPAGVTMGACSVYSFEGETCRRFRNSTLGVTGRTLPSRRSLEVCPRVRNFAGGSCPRPACTLCSTWDVVLGRCESGWGSTSRGVSAAIPTAKHCEVRVLRTGGLISCAPPEPICRWRTGAWTRCSQWSRTVTTRRGSLPKPFASSAPGGVVAIADFLYDPRNPAYRDRYAEMGFSGELIARDAQGAILYRARHWRADEIDSMMDGSADRRHLHLGQVSSRTGNPLTGFEVIYRRRVAPARECPSGGRPDVEFVSTASGYAWVSCARRAPGRRRRRRGSAPLVLAGGDDQGGLHLLDGLAEGLAPEHGVQHVVSSTGPCSVRRSARRWLCGATSQPLHLEHGEDDPAVRGVCLDLPGGHQCFREPRGGP